MRCRIPVFPVDPVGEVQLSVGRSRQAMDGKKKPLLFVGSAAIEVFVQLVTRYI